MTNSLGRHHRQVIIEHMGDASKELAFIESALKEDPKNFHAWSYR
jgi:protein farnesyltransferase/geranylgeranyltransferase type-1 subunit alpha